MTDRTWHKGSPPHVGWWNASFNKRIHSWRWWDGEKWSEHANRFDSQWKATIAAAKPEWDILQKYIEWTDYWPENARVPRVNPDAS